MIKKRLSQESFLIECCKNSYIGDYLFVFYLASLDRLNISDVPIFIYVKKNGFANPKVHEIKEKFAKTIISCGYSIPYIFSDGDSIDQNQQMKIQNLWNPILLQNCECIFNDIAIQIDNCFFNFPIQVDNGLFYLGITDGMHLLKRIRYEIMNQLNLYLVRNFEGSIQITTFYVPEFQSIVKDECPDFVFCREQQTKMDDDYPHELFKCKMCPYL